MVGLQMKIEHVKATSSDGTLRTDARVYATLPNGESKLRLYLTHSQSAWLGAGLGNGDQLLSVNGLAVETEGEFNDLLNAFRVGERVKVEVMRAGRRLQMAVEMGFYDWPDVRIRQLPAASRRYLRVGRLANRYGIRGNLVED